MRKALVSLWDDTRALPGYVDNTVVLLPDNLDFTQSRCTLAESTLANTRSFVLDNGVLRLSVLPDFGGRLCSIFYRPLNRELLATEFMHGPRKSLTIHGGWCAAFPSLLADGEAISRTAWETEVAEQSEQRLVLRLWCLVERVSHKVDDRVRESPGMIIVERFIRLTAGEPAVIVEDVLTNRNSWPLSTTWSGVISLRAQAGDRAVLPADGVTVQRGVGPVGNELDFGLLVATPYQAMARNLHEGWLGLRLSAVPVDLRLTFPLDLLPHALIVAQRDEEHPGEEAFRFQPLATTGPIADDTRDGALRLPPKQSISLPLRLEVGTGIIPGGDWSCPGLQLAQLIADQHVPAARLALWRVGESAMVVKTHALLAMLMPEVLGDPLLSPEDLPAADLLICAQDLPPACLPMLVKRSAARFIGPAALRQALLREGLAEDRSIALSPGARVDLPGFGILATPAYGDFADERLGYLLQADHLLLYHLGPTAFLGEFGPIGEQFHPQLLLLPLEAMTLADALHAARLLQPRLVVPLGSERAETEFIHRCRAQHVSFALRTLRRAEGVLFDGWKLHPLEAGIV